VDDLLDVLTRELEETDTTAAPVALNVALIGRPNAGKSTLLNRLVGKQRTIVAAEPGTTRDAVDTLVPANGAWWRLVDTAGIRRKARTDLRAEKLSVVMARKHLERADVAVLLLDATRGVTRQDATIGSYAHDSGDATRGVTRQDATIGSYAHDSGRSVILAMNKWDAVEKDTHTVETWKQSVRRRLKFLDYAPLIFISALNGQRIARLSSERAAYRPAPQPHCRNRGREKEAGRTGGNGRLPGCAAAGARHGAARASHAAGGSETGGHGAAIV
jgi:predicted GTPase